MKTFFEKFVLGLLAAAQLSCTQNMLYELGSKSSDESLLFDAKTAVNNQDYQTAIDIITTRMSLQAQTQTVTKEVLASGYAGKCGLNFLNFVDALSTATSGSAFQLVSSPFLHIAVDPPSCLQALNVLQTIGPSASRTNSENAFASIVGMSLMGSATRLYTDNSPVNGDGSQDSADISCGLSNTQIDYIVLGFGFMSENFSYLSAAQLGSSSQSSLNTIISTCTSIAGSNCTITDPSLITNPIRDTIKDLMNSVEYGIGTVVTAGNAPPLVGACP